MSREHELRTWPSFFDAVWSGEKLFEVRYDDRGFHLGDTVRLREWESHIRSGSWTLEGRYTGREITARIGYVLPMHAIHAFSQPVSQVGPLEGYVVFSLLDIERIEVAA